MNVLDKSSLSTLWTKIKEYVNNPASRYDRKELVTIASGDSAVLPYQEDGRNDYFIYEANHLWLAGYILSTKRDTVCNIIATDLNGTYGVTYEINSNHTITITNTNSSAIKVCCYLTLLWNYYID